MGGTPAPVIPTEPVTPTPVTPAPVTAAPTTPTPTTPSPTTPAPTTPAPTTGAPTTTTQAPVAPAGYQWGAHGQLCPISLSSTFAKCLVPTDSHTDINLPGYINCNAYDADCCMCAMIECGHNVQGVPCNNVNIGTSGAYGTVM